MNRVVTISGSSGVGKTTLASVISLILGSEKSCKISGDDLHKWKRGDENWKKYTHLNPRANNIDLGENQLQNLKNNKSVLRKIYNHDTGDFEDEVEIFPKEWIIYEGLHALHGEVNKLSEFRIFVETDDELSSEWKIKRDVNKRGYTKQQVLDAIELRKNDDLLYIAPQREFANVIVKFEKTSNKIVMNYTCLENSCEDLMKNVRKFHDSMNEFVNLCKRLSLEPSLVQGRGGNVSVKFQDMIIVTSSGHFMADTNWEHGFCICDMNRKVNTKNEDDFLNSCRSSKISGDSNPSMELALHMKMQNRVVAHTHPVHLNSVLCAKESRDILKSIFPTLKYEYVEYVSPGLQLFLKLNSESKIVFLENHGLLVAGDSEKEVFEMTEFLDAKCKEWILEHSEIHIDVGIQKDEGYLFPDAAILPDEMKFTIRQISHNIASTGLIPRFLTSDQLAFLFNMKAEKDRQHENYRANGRNRR